MSGTTGRDRARENMAEVSEGTRNAMRMSVTEGALSTVMANLAGGTYLTGFALSLGAQEAVIGLLAALPNVANLFQVFGGYLLRRIPGRRLPCTLTLLASRLMWVPVLLLPWLFPNSTAALALTVLIVAYGLSSILAAVSGVTWLSWLADIVPEHVRGRYFSRRNMLGTALGVVAALAAGRFVDVWGATHKSPYEVSLGFVWIFVSGVGAGLVAVYFMSRMPEVRHEREPETPFLGAIREPLGNPSFRLLIYAMALWGFAVAVASPFFSVHMIENLNLPFSLIASFGLVSSALSIAGTRLWGPLVDTLGPAIALRIGTFTAASIPFIWLFPTHQTYYIIFIINGVSGLAWAGIGIASSTLLLKLSPATNRSVYLGMYAAVTGVATALAPLVGGAFGQLVRNWNLDLPGVHLTGLHFVFLLSFTLRLTAATLLIRVRAPREHSLRAMMRAFRRSPGFRRTRTIAMSPVFATRQLWYSGLGAVENMTTAFSRGLIASERYAEQVGTGTLRLLASAGEAGRSGWYLAESLLITFEQWFFCLARCITRVLGGGEGAGDTTPLNDDDWSDDPEDEPPLF